MKKVGIMTFNNSYNYGAALQAYALKEAVNMLGYEASVIDYTIVDDYNRYSHKILSSGLKIAPVKIKDYISNKRRMYAFSTFRRNNFNLSKDSFFDYDDLSKLNDSYDIFIVGSDQVWNLNLTNGIHNNFLLSFTADNKLRIAYAASLGKGERTFYDNADLLRPYLSRFHAISCREESGAQLLTEITGRDVPVVLDPTLLHDSAFYKNISLEYKNKKEKYILVYSMGSKIPKEYIFKLARKKHLKIKYSSRLFHMGLSERFSHSGPAEFIDLVANAEYIITSSFHGTVFSILFKKQFCVYSKNDNRIQPILTRFGLLDRILSENFNIDKAINYKKVFDLIELERKRSFDFLRTSLEL